MPEMEDCEINDIREKRLAELKRQAKLKQDSASNSFGSLERASNERELIMMMSSTPRLVIHFCKLGFRRCDIMSKHLQMLAQSHPETRFVEIEAESAPFLAAKFLVKMLPFLVVIVDSIGVDNLVGFEELGGSDDFDTCVLERRLAASDAIFSPAKADSSDSE